MPPAARLVLVIAVVAGAALVAVFSADPGAPVDPFAFGTAAGTPLPATCLDLPASKPAPRWIPRSLPLPEGTYVSEIPPKPVGARLVVWTAQAGLDAFVEVVREDWTAEGWEITHGEREPGEAEGTLTDGERIIFFRARQVYCDQGWTQVLLGLARRR